MRDFLRTQSRPVRQRCSEAATSTWISRASDVFQFIAVLALVVAAALPALAQSAFYVDPDRTGSQNGSADKPWASLDASTWTTINASLSTNPVTIYFSALKSDGVTQQSRAWFVECKRWDYSTNRLTLDGYSFYNANASSPSWTANPQTDISVAYTNRQVFQITGASQCAIGWIRTSGNDFVTNNGIAYCCIESHLANPDNAPGVGANWTRYWDAHSWTNTGAYPLSVSAWTSGTSYRCHVKQNNITLRGFEITGSGARSAFSGDNFLWEYNYAHDITTIGAAVNFLYTTYPDSPSAQVISAACTNAIMRHFRIVNTEGEAVYIGAINPSSTTNLEVRMGNQRSGILITSFYIRGAGANGGQGDGIDCKHGITGLQIMDGEISWGGGTGNGINLPETITPADQGSLVERVFVHDYSAVGGGGNGIIGATQGTLAGPFYGHSGTMIRNCVIANCAGGGITLEGYSPSIITNCFIYNCTVFNSAIGMKLFGATNCGAMNNFVFGGGTLRGQMGSVGVLSDYNAHDGSWIGANEGPHTLTLATSAAIDSVVSVNNNRFDLVTGSPLIGAGATLTNFNGDFTRLIRSPPWDIGAFSYFGVRATRPAAPPNMHKVL